MSTSLISIYINPVDTPEPRFYPENRSAAHFRKSQNSDWSDSEHNLEPQRHHADVFYDAVDPATVTDCKLGALILLATSIYARRAFIWLWLILKWAHSCPAHTREQIHLTGTPSNIHPVIRYCNVMYALATSLLKP